MNVAVIGLGLIGGSMAKALTAAGHTVLGYDRDRATLSAALSQRAVSGWFDPGEPWNCELAVIALYPQGCVDFLSEHAGRIGRGTLVVDCCGVKGAVCPAAFGLAREHGFIFVGGHPMAGTEKSGFAASRADLFSGASMLLVPPDGADERLKTRLGEIFLPLGFREMKFTTAKEHDDMIAYTSQLAHIVSSAYIKSPAAGNFAGFSAGSFRDMTRVAYLNEEMWTQLFLDNAAALSREIDGIVKRLREYGDAVRTRDAETLTRLLREGRLAKISSDEKGGRENETH